MAMRTCQKIKTTVNVLGKFSLRDFSGVTNLKMSKWQEEKDKFLGMSLENKRDLYKSYTQLKDIPTWQEYAKKESLAKKIAAKLDFTMDDSLNETLREKISLFQGDITKLEVMILSLKSKNKVNGGL